MNDVDFPVARVLAGIDAAAEAGLPVKVNVVVKRGLNESSILDIARRFRGTGHAVRFIEFMDVGATNGWRLDDVVPAAEIVSTIGAEFPLEPVRGRVPRRGRRALPVPRRRRRDRRHRLGHAALLRRLHPRAHLGRRQALHLPLRRPRPRPASAPPLRLERRARGDDPRRVDAPRRSLLRDPHGGDLGAAQGRDVVHRRLARPSARSRPARDRALAGEQSTARSEGGAAGTDDHRD